METKEKKEKKMPTPYEGINIKINRNWSVKSDIYNWILINKVGNRIEGTTYHNSLGSLCKSYVDDSIKDTQCKDLDSLIKAVEKSTKDINAFIKKNVTPLVEEVVRKEVKEIKKEMENNK